MYNAKKRRQTISKNNNKPVSNECEPRKTDNHAGHKVFA